MNQSKYYSQARQDLFVREVLNYKTNGTFIDIASGDPIVINNSYMLEQQYGWRGVLIDINPQFIPSSARERSSPFLCADALKMDWKKELIQLGFPVGTVFDYLSFDLDDVGEAALVRVPFDDYKFRVVTMEHDSYTHGSARADRMRAVLLQRGYEIICKNVKNLGNSYEDWWIHPSLVDLEIANRYRCDSLEFDKIISDSGKSLLVSLPKTKKDLTANESFNVESLSLSPSTYSRYENAIRLDPNLSSFKRNDVYREILEHVTVDYGRQYLRQLLQVAKIPISNIVHFCNLNDSIGAPLTFDIGLTTTNESLQCSPTSLRYLWQAWCILQASENAKKFVEIGAGYGGLCLAISYLIRFHYKRDSIDYRYVLVDLDAPSDLQRLYLARFSDIAIENLTFLSFSKVSDSEKCAALFKERSWFLISNYAFSEFDNATQQTYVKTIFPFVSHGYLEWNSASDPYALLPSKNLYISDENPKTGVHNKTITF